MRKTNGETMREIALQLCPEADVVTIKNMFEGCLEDLNEMLNYMYSKKDKDEFDERLIQRYEHKVDLCIEGLHKYNCIP